MPACGRPGEHGVSLVALMVGITLMMIAIAIMLPSWSYVMQNEREQELLFRGEQIARAIEFYQQSNANALPPSLEALAKAPQRHLRKLYKDPMTRDGKWRLMHPGEPCIPIEDLQSGGRGRAPAAAATFGAISGVASVSPDKSLRIFNGQRRYSAWCFIAGQPRIVGRPQQVGPRGGPLRTPTPRR